MGVKGYLDNGETITENIWLRDNDKYKKVKVVFNNEGIVEKTEEIVNSLDEISKAIESSETLGNPEEYLKILELQGRMQDVQKVIQQYEFFMNNREKISEVERKEFYSKII